MKRFYSSLLVVSLASCSVSPATMIFDLDGVLLQKSISNVVWNIGPTNLFRINPFKAHKIKQTLFSFLDRLEPRRDDTPLAYNNGLVLPQIMCDWQTGTTRADIIKHRVAEALEHQDDFFNEHGCKSAVTAIANFMFTPELLAASMKPLKAGKQLLKRCKKAGHKVYIITNFDPESFKLLYNNKKIKRMFDLCDGICVSGFVGFIKPDPAIYQTLFENWEIDPNNELTFYFDDEPCNIDAAFNLQKEYLKPVLIKEGSFASAYKVLQQHGIIF